MPVEAVPFAETWDAAMNAYMDAEATGNREAAVVANDILENLAMGAPKAYLDMIATRRMANLAINT